MRIVLRQEFPLGRFHATPWRVNPFDDPHGEWPPSPWRLVRAVTARWYQWVRETGTKPNLAEIETLQAALCKSAYAFHLPPSAGRGSPLRQYHPTEFEMDPPNWRHVACFHRDTGIVETPEGRANKESKAKPKTPKGVKLAERWLEARLEWEVTVKDKGADESKKKVEEILGAPAAPWQRVADAGARGYGRSLVQDNYWCVSPEAPVWWFIDGQSWTSELVAVLDPCLARMTYFGRAETLTRIRRVGSRETFPAPNCTLVDERTRGAVPILSPLGSATRADIERTTDDPEAVKRSVPPGTRVLYAVRPPHPVARERRRAPAHQPDCHLMQFALGWNVTPDPRTIVRLTSRFRGRVIHELLRLKTGDASATWSRVGREVREALSDMAGKDADGEPLKGHRHTEYLAWCEEGRPTRLLVWRGSRSFDDYEYEAILLAASRDVSWAAAGSDADKWKVRLIPLDRAVPPPPGFDGTSAAIWQSVTPYVPPRYHLRSGKQRERESVAVQVRREISERGIHAGAEVTVEEVSSPQWVSVHVPRSRASERESLGDRRGYLLRLTFSEPLRGPLRLGHSSSFGLGLFRSSL